MNQKCGQKILLDTENAKRNARDFEKCAQNRLWGFAAKILFVALCVLLQSALAQNAKPLELWQTCWNSKDAAPLPPPATPWQSAMWTTGALGPNSTADDVKNLAILCRDGGAMSGRMKKSTLAYLRFYGRLDSFPKERIPAGTLLIADFEGSEDTEYPALLCNNIRGITSRFAQYPGGAMASDEGVNFGWTSQLREVDFFCLQRGWMNSKRAGAVQKKIRDLSGDYILFELYLSDPKLKGNQDAQFLAWSLQLNFVRANVPEKKVLALLKGSYSWPGTGAMSDEERHRLVRFTLLFDGVWAFGDRAEALPLMDDIAALAADPLHAFAGEENWARQ